MKNFWIIIISASIIAPAIAFATPGVLKRFTAQYPSAIDSQLDSCRTCHLPAINNCLNSYAAALKENTLAFEKVENLDSDGDGVNNIDEIMKLQLPGSQAGPDELFLFTNRMGIITFNHEKHSLDPMYLSNGKCDNCHTEELFPRMFDDTKSWQNISHKVCKDCHRSSERPNAPIRCRQCHIKKEQPS